MSLSFLSLGLIIMINLRQQLLLFHGVSGSSDGVTCNNVSLIPVIGREHYAYIKGHDGDPSGMLWLY